MNVSIQVLYANEPLQTLHFAAPGALLVGRHVECDVRLEDSLVSRVHARVDLGNGFFSVEDLSSNGTGLNEGVLHKERQNARYGDCVYIGQFQLIIDQEVPQVPMMAPAAGVRAAPPLPVPVAGGAALPPARPPARKEPSSVKMAAAAPVGPAVPTMLGKMMPAGLLNNPVNIVNGGHANGNGHAHAHVPAHVPGLHALDQPLPNNLDAARLLELGSKDRNDIGDIRRLIHQKLLENLDLAKIEGKKLDDPSMRPRVLTALKRLVKEYDAQIPAHINRDAFIGEIAEEALGLGPLEPLLADPTITEIMVVNPTTIYIERAGKLERTGTQFTDDERVRAVIERIVTPLGRRIDESSPVVDARLKDGSRVNAVIRPITLKGTCITIRKFPKKRLQLADLIGMKTISEQMARFLTRAVIAKKNILISGGTGSGKTTFLNVLSGAIPPEERIITIEDAAELQLHQPHVVGMETKTANMEGKGALTIRDLVKNALRMRPDRIIVGECRGAEALDMLQAMNTGHDGSLTTLHSNSPQEAVARLETLVLMAGMDLPSRAVREQISRSIHLIVQQSRYGDGSRKISSIAEVAEIDRDSGAVETRIIFEFERSGTGPNGEVLGDFRATGYLPSFIDEFIIRGLVKRGERYL
jgi:pilus assembly protein CpaF